MQLLAGTCTYLPALFVLPWLLHCCAAQVLACIGEQFDEGDEVCGVTVNIRAGKDRIEMWTKTAANEALQMSIGKQLKQLLDIPDSNKIGFVVFVSALPLLLCNMVHDIYGCVCVLACACFAAMAEGTCAAVNCSRCVDGPVKLRAGKDSVSLHQLASAPYAV
jgi:hypothetical protein